MSDARRIHEDIQYVREIVARSEQSNRRPVLIYWTWALFVLITYPMMDFAPRYINFVSLPGLIICFALTIYLSRRFKQSLGIKQRRDRSGLFWFGGSILLIFCSISLSIVMHLHGQASGQLSVVFVGIFYFLGGVNYDRNFLWLGPLLCVAGLAVGFVPHYGWTALGIVFALGLIVPTLFAPRPPEALAENVPAETH